MDFSIIEKAGLSMKETSRLLDVSAVMVFKYIHGKALPTRKHLPRTETTLTVLERLVERKQLPRADLGKNDPHHEVRAKRAAIVEKIRHHIDTQLAAALTDV